MHRFPYTEIFRDGGINPWGVGKTYYYRQQRSWGKVMFSKVCVILFTGGSASMHAGTPPPSPAKETPLPRRPPPLPRRSPCQGDPQGDPLQGDPPPRRPPRRPPPRRSPIGDPPSKKTPPPGSHLGGKLRGIRSRPTAKGEIEGDQIQAHTKGGNSGGSDPGPRGKFRGIRSRPTPKGEIESDQIQAHIQGGNWEGSDPGPHPRGKFRGIRFRPPLMTTAAGGKHPTGMHSCLARFLP